MYCGTLLYVLLQGEQREFIHVCMLLPPPPLHHATPLCVNNAATVCGHGITWASKEI